MRVLKEYSRIRETPFFTILSSRITPSTPPPLLIYSWSLERLVVRARRCECSGQTSAMRRFSNSRPPFAKLPLCMLPNWIALSNLGLMLVSMR